jgi:hypothetical protein
MGWTGMRRSVRICFGIVLRLLRGDKKGRKVFFSEEKKQKTFAFWRARRPAPVDQAARIF